LLILQTALRLSHISSFYSDPELHYIRRGLVYMERKIEDIIESLRKAKDPIFRMLGGKGLFQDRGVPVLIAEVGFQLFSASSRSLAPPVSPIYFPFAPCSSPSPLVLLQSHVTARSRPVGRRAARWPRARYTSLLPACIKADANRWSHLPATARPGNCPWDRRRGDR
jgi:hypothetical protein